jgi:1,4-alpha-glucan branching enzyme
MSTPHDQGAVRNAAFAAGTDIELHRWLGAHWDGASTTFRVWAPSAQAVSVLLGDGPEEVPAERDGTIWTATSPAAPPGSRYRFRIHTAAGPVDHVDPFARQFEPEPAAQVGMVTAPSEFQWSDDAWLTRRAAGDQLDQRMSIYEIHLGSWGLTPHVGPGRFATYREIAVPLADHVTKLGFTHVELLPITEHPFYGSWGYQCTGYFGPTARYGSPDDLRFLVDVLHQRGIGVILDWVPSHFPIDSFGLFRFDGTELFESPGGLHPEWGSAEFDYARGEVRSFLISSAHSWIEDFHIDALRVDGVASMLYLDYGRSDGEWTPNEAGGREDLAAVRFLRELNDGLHARHPGVLSIAEESTAWAGVTAPTADGGLGFDLKWDMGWMHDTLKFLGREPVHRRWHYHEITFRGNYMWAERWVLPLSHDEVVHLKGSLINKAPGNQQERQASLRMLLGLQWTMPGRPLAFMGTELGPWSEWAHEAELDWSLLETSVHRGIRDWLCELNTLTVDWPALWQRDDHPDGFGWLVAHDEAHCVYAYVRRSTGASDVVVAVNATPIARPAYRIPVPTEGVWRVLACSEEARFGGHLSSEPGSSVAFPDGDGFVIDADLPGLSVTVFSRD